MNLGSFISELVESGNATVPPLAEFTDDDLLAGREALAELDRLARLDLPGTPPPYHPVAAIWAATLFCRASQCLVFREVDAAGVQELLRRPCPRPATPDVVYSVDLCFRCLPELWRLARAAASADPLVGCLEEWAVAWPLSSVGMELSEAPLKLEPILADACLRQLYVDRIIARRDRRRAAEPRVQALVAQTLGAYPELAPELVPAP